MSARATVVLVRHAPTASTRRSAFPADEELDRAGRDDAAALKGRIFADRAVAAPPRRCAETAALAGFAELQTDPRWAELDFGRWSGATMSEVADTDPAALEAWLADPAAAPPGGESFNELARRVSEALDELLEPGRTTVVFTSGGPVKAAVMRVLGAPPEAVWRIDASPCAMTTLHGRIHGGHRTWTLRSHNVEVPR